MNAIEVKNLFCGYGAEQIVKDVSFSAAFGEFVGILGPNGSGKTTLLRALTGIVPVSKGEVKFEGDDIHTLTRREISRRVACVMQDSAASWGAESLAYSVREVIAMGRTPYLTSTGWETPSDRAAVASAMERAEVAHLADRPINEISGGERQRAFIGMALAQESKIALLDEPTNHLDITHQIAVLELFRMLTRETGRATVGVFHDLNLAAEYCDRVLLMKSGAVAALGEPDAVLRADLIREVYGATVAVQPNPFSGRPHVFLTRER